MFKIVISLVICVWQQHVYKITDHTVISSYKLISWAYNRGRGRSVFYDMAPDRSGRLRTAPGGSRWLRLVPDGYKIYCTRQGSWIIMRKIEQFDIISTLTNQILNDSHFEYLIGPNFVGPN